MSLLDLAGVSYRVGNRHIVDDVDLSVSGGEMVTLVGPNGAGKTTSVRLVGGDVVATAGTVRIGGSAIGSLPPLEAARRRAVMPQTTTVRFPFRALDIVMMGRFAVGADRHTDLEVCRSAMERTDTAHLADEFFPVLSGGEQALVNLARTLVQEAPLLVLDEPTGSLDVRHQQMVMRLLRETTAGGAGCLLVLHDLNLAAGFSDRLLLMHEGRVVAEGDPAEVLDAALLTEVYNQPMAVVPHPEGHGLLVLPREG